MKLTLLEANGRDEMHITPILILDGLGLELFLKNYSQSDNNSETY